MTVFCLLTQHTQHYAKHLKSLGYFTTGFMFVVASHSPIQSVYFLSEAGRQALVNSADFTDVDAPRFWSSSRFLRNDSQINNQASL